MNRGEIVAPVKGFQVISRFKYVSGTPNGIGIFRRPVKGICDTEQLAVIPVTGGRTFTDIMRHTPTGYLVSFNNLSVDTEGDICAVFNARNRDTPSNRVNNRETTEVLFAPLGKCVLNRVSVSVDPCNQKTEEIKILRDAIRIFQGIKGAKATSRVGTGLLLQFDAMRLCARKLEIAGVSVLLAYAETAPIRQMENGILLNV